MADKPLVSIVVPIFNMGSQLREAAKGFLNQTYTNIEIILVDDGSTDDTSAVCCALAEADSRVSVFRQNNMGSGPARNKGIENAHGKYVYFADADDLMSNDLIEKIVSRMEQKNCDMAVFGFKRILAGGFKKAVHKLNGEVFECDKIRREYHKFYDHNSLSGIQGGPWNKMFRLDKIRDNGIKYPPMRRHQDEVFIMRYVDKAERVLFVDDILYIHNTNDRSMLFKKFPKNYYDIVSQLKSFRMEYIYGWNTDNHEMLDIISRDFVYNTGISLMFMFNPSFEYTPIERYREIKRVADRFLEELPDKYYDAHSTMFRLMKKKRYLMLYAVAYMGLRKYY